MFIRDIHLENFRNYGRLDLDVGPSVNIFYGDNAQGKTNIIEAVYVACSVASHRTGRDLDMIRFGADYYLSELTVSDDYGSKTKLSSSFINSSGRTKRVLKQDGLEIRRISDYIGVCNTVIFAPEDLNIVKGSPASRRKFLNSLIMKVSPSYVNLLGDINRLIIQKNTYLKSARFKNKAECDRDLDFWDFSIASLSADIVLYRYRFSKLLSQSAGEHHSSISGGREVLSLLYSSISGIVSVLEGLISENDVLYKFMSGNLSGGDYERIKGILSDNILVRLQSVRSYDIEKGISSVGINKDDLIIELDSLSMRNFSSQGQQRSAALALKLSELDIIRRFSSSSPVLLLDDVFSELDLSRRVSLVSAMNGAQIFITCTDKSFISDELEGIIGENTAGFYCVHGGEVTEG